jgi:pimeloyl-ACP methyl ester carboxylesterase
MLSSPSAPLVFLVHGFLRTGASMVPMAAGLKRYGYQPSVVTQMNLHRGIPDLADSLYDHVALFRDKLEERTGERPDAHFVTHSMGGVVVRSMLSRHEVDGPNRCVLLAPPNKGSRLAQHMRGRLGFPWGSFDPLAKLLPGELGQCEDSGAPDAVIGIIVGTGSGGVGPPWGALSDGFKIAADGEHDGTVAADETHLDSAVDTVRVPYAHSLMMLRRHVIQLTASFLREGRFN